MRLTQLRPKWSGLPGAAKNVEAQSIKIGFTFDCPCAACAVNGRGNRLWVPVNPPIDPYNVLADSTWVSPPSAWKRTGDTFETITLEPSIDASARGHWHGLIVNGEAISA